MHGHEVAFQIVFVFRRVRTENAGIGAFACVNPHMPGQVGRSWKGFGTNGAGSVVAALPPKTNSITIACIVPWRRLRHSRRWPWQIRNLQEEIILSAASNNCNLGGVLWTKENRSQTSAVLQSITRRSSPQVASFLGMFKDVVTFEVSFVLCSVHAQIAFERSFVGVCPQVSLQQRLVYKLPRAITTFEECQTGNWSINISVIFRKTSNIRERCPRGRVWHFMCGRKRGEFHRTT